MVRGLLGKYKEGRSSFYLGLRIPLLAVESNCPTVLQAKPYPLL